MAMPVDVVLVRHGESEGNVANTRSRAGDDSRFTPEFLGRSSYSWRLTEHGKEEMRVTGEWLHQHMEARFDAYFVSFAARALASAALLDLPGARWRPTVHLRERYFGAMDVMPQSERVKRYAETLEARKRDPFFWQPPGGGENMDTICLRLRSGMLSTLHRDFVGERVILVCHKYVMEAFRLIFEYLTRDQYNEIHHSTDPLHKIHKGQVLWYSRRNPKTGRVGPYLDWVFSACPPYPEKATNQWRRIDRTEYTNEELLTLADQWAVKT